ncbi:fibrinogen-like YCDxxxxGGGW domain-containing protein [Rothia sp. ZJ1223]|uniref:fibrinogen-like YCDxxxxGGGW domain-containing protein n=1 Tax=Rothia sp. ZJ1223 TaxID=2811098 RepID=UPI00195F1B3F|nr:fibrinogen-like YCDxxxxGGGW domain-containing protein [Rothia sp. ZJ1223]MBM7051380.1 fibrinogen [Rothia sp. ZJ1223]
MKFRNPFKIAAGAVAVVSVATLLPLATADNAEAATDGSSSATAAASCWEIKQKNPEASSGAYWLFTPQMDAPEQFYCDQETDGGGWVMIGRGREGWTEEYTGKGKPADMANNPDGTDAFAPIQLPSETVDALLGDQPVNQLADGVRFARPLNPNGTGVQNVYAKRASQEDWSWALRAKAQWQDIRFNAPSNFLSASGRFGMSYGSLANFDPRYKRLEFTAGSETNWKLGFAFGNLVRGNNNAETYHWSKGNNQHSPLGFTQVYLRPKLTQKNLNFTTIADAGTPESQRRALPNSFTSAWNWRTSDATGSGATGEMNSYVQAITQVGNTVFIGGDFKHLESKNGETVNQSYIAGFDVNSTELVRTFMPKLNGQVKTMAALPGGKLAVGGDFTRANGTPVTNFVIFDPATGQIDTTWDWDIANRGASGVTQVKTLEVQGNYLYVGGTFTHVKGDTSGTYAFSRNAARFDLTNGSVDWSWRPNFNGTVNGISAAEDGQSVHVAGYFSTNHSAWAWKLAALNTTNGKNLTRWDWELSNGTTANARQGFQFDVQDTGAHVWTAGAEHLIAQYQKGSYKRLSSSITKSGGDFQEVTYKDGVIYGACHCGDWIYEGGRSYRAPWEENNNVHTIRLTTAFDAVTGEVLPDFAPLLQGKSGFGVWSQFFDSNGNLWVGGDINRSLGANGAQPTVGFARFTPRDVTPAAIPANLAVTTEGGYDKLTWNSAGNGLTYQILRNDRVIGTSTATSFEVAHLDNARYFVRSVDQAGNYSASTAAVAVGKAEEAPVAEPVAPIEEQPETPVVPEEKPEAPVEDEAKPEAPAAPAEKPEEDAQPDVEPVAPAEPEAPVEDEAKPEAPAAPVAPDAPAVNPAFKGKLIAAGAQWQYITDINEWQRKNWYTTNTSVTGWKTGTAPLGWGPGVATTLERGRYGMPISIQARHEFNLPTTVPAGKKLVLHTRADDGVAVYVNGVEVGRQNLPAQHYPLTPADFAVDTQFAIDNPVVIEVPSHLLKQGKNVIAVDSHARRRSTANHTMELTASWR